MRSILTASLFTLMAAAQCQAQAPGQESTGRQDDELRAVMSHIRTRAYDRIHYPRFISAERADAFIKPAEKVVGVVIHQVAKAYPVKFLDGREVVNDSLARNPITVTW